MAFSQLTNQNLHLKICDRSCGVFITRVSLRHTTMFTYSHTSTPPGQSERAYYLIYFQVSYDHRTCERNLRNCV